jgi:hypothetical protein
MWMVLLGLVTVLLVAVTECQPGAGLRDSLKNPFLMLAQAQFNTGTPGNSASNPVPGAARLEIVYPFNKSWKSVVIEDPDSNVFHKAMVFKPAGMGQGILTIGANKAMLKLWRLQNDGKWQAETIWSVEFGGKQNRLRDMEVGDVTGDGKPDIVVATHDQGVIAVLEQENNKWKVTELNRTPDTFVHEIEIGDIDGDGKNEFFATPSAPNKLDGTPQPGLIVMYKYANGEFVRTVVEEFPTRHVKEILIADILGTGHPDLYASVEAEGSQLTGAQQSDAGVQIKRYHWENGSFSSQVIGILKDLLCRFLLADDIDNDGKPELIAAPLKTGIWVFKPSSPMWESKQIATESSGFEHAMCIADLDGDGKKEIYAAADDQHQLQKFTWDGQTFLQQNILGISENRITFGLTAGKFE